MSTSDYGTTAPQGTGSGGPSAAEIAARARARRAAKAALSPEGIEADLADRRARLASDLAILGAHLAPEALKTRAASSAREAVTQARVGFTSALFPARAGATRQSENTGVGYGSAPLAPPPSILDRVNRLLDDARDGDPASLGIVTGASLILAGVSVFAALKALRR
ncbi:MULTISPECIES: DUF3618 domain-containing protein [Actinomyces]|uniref:DUF3618 domain-containing protein n=1 Tax=Actinomyces respiraculi TaxID=2744574 RepID=A0A7T0PW54_9ACTO|nr:MULTISPECIES: DUF3618 domain-containing protein [Actinomyces]QPL05168.1 DUF3618 domain-containing protein [Actinomyces respiraculi]